jgi:hypothetical protein
MSLDLSTGWPTIAEPAAAPNVPHCVWVKITQLLGEVSCYLLPVHDGPHCSVDWMEWT